MNKSECVFIDTSPFIYLIENNPEYCATVANYLADQSMKDNLLTTSVITISEFQVNPKKLNILKPIEDFQKLIEQLNIEIFEVTLEIAELSATLRAKYSFLRSIDAIQIAIAVNHSCESFFTHDFRLKNIKELNIIIVNDIK
ncbi:MAG: type II toxin-antitoxin system VapC family toxin [Cyclobacteriaceae bacterium]|nr:type II toxin-antitoxin system VapC family toxin [Cyclobacteriaceae bacterium]